MPSISAEPEDITIEDRSRVKTLLREAFDYKRELIERQDDVQQETKTLREEISALQKQVEAIEEKHEGYIQRREDAIEVRQQVVKDWAEAHQDEMLADQSGKTFKTPFGAVSFKQKRFNFDWIDKDKAIEHLKKLGHSGLVKMTETVYKKDLKKHPELCSELEGVDPIPEHDVASVELTIG